MSTVCALTSRLLSLVSDHDRSGVNVPGIRMVDAAEGVIGMNWIEGSSVRHLLPGGAEEDEDLGEDVDPLLEYGVSQGNFIEEKVIDDFYVVM